MVVLIVSDQIESLSLVSSGFECRELNTNVCLQNGFQQHVVRILQRVFND